jgi:hypothetical protein
VISDVFPLARREGRVRPEDRKFLVNDAQAAVRALDLVEDRRDPPTIGAVVIEELDDRDASGQVAADGRGRVTKDFTSSCRNRRPNLVLPRGARLRGARPLHSSGSTLPFHYDGA